MKRLITLIIVSLFSIQTSIAQNIQWAKGGGGSDADESYCVAADASGNTYITGIFSTSATIAGTTITAVNAADMYVAKFDPSGNLLWIEQAGGNGLQGGHMVTVDSNGNVYATGEFEDTITFGATILPSSGMGDIFIAKYDASGTLLWAVKAGGPGNESVNSINTDQAGDAYLTGSFEDTAQFGSFSLQSSGNRDMYAMKCDSQGNIIWAVKGGGSFDDSGRGMAMDNNGNLRVAGYFSDSAMFGSFNLMSSGSKDMFVAGISPAGLFQWAVSAGGNETDQAYEADIDAAGNCYIAGSFKDTAVFGFHTIISSGSDDIFITKIDASGNFLWAKSGGGSGEDKAYAVAVSDAGVYLTGSFEDTLAFGTINLASNGDKDIFISGWDSSGTVQWAFQEGGPGYDRGYGIAGASGAVWVTGIFEQAVTFGTNVFTSNGLTDLFLIKILTPASITDYPADDFIINCYPNPAKGNLFIHNNSQGYKNYLLHLTDMTGKTILKQDSDHRYSYLDISMLEKGCYVLNFSSEEKRGSKIIVKF